MYQSREEQTIEQTGSSDPSQVDGFKKLYMNQLSFQIRLQQQGGIARTLPKNQLIYVKILLRVIEQSQPQLKIQLTCDSDLYFNFQTRIDTTKFQSLKLKQHINVQFNEFIDAQKQPNNFYVVFTIFSDMQGRFNVIQKTQFKNYEILSFDFRKATDVIEYLTQHFIKQNIFYRYNMMKHNIVNTIEKLQQIDQTIKCKNPSLLLQIRKKMPNLSFMKK